MASRFSTSDWRSIRREFDSRASNYGLPERRFGSVLLASFNVRELGSVRNRNANEWEFLAGIIKAFDLIAVQEIGDNLSGLHRIMELLGPDYSVVVSDQTGVYPGVSGNLERLGFIYRRSVVNQEEVASDITFDRSQVLDLIADNLDAISQAMSRYIQRRKRWQQGRGSKPRLSSVNMPVFLSFIRQPHCVSFSLEGNPGVEPIRFMAANAHLYYGVRLSDRNREIKALINWITDRLGSSEHVYAPNFILFGDLNYDYNNPDTDRAWSDELLKSFNGATGANVEVNFPFLDVHAGRPDIFRTNARRDQTYDHIGLFGSDPWVWRFDENKSLPTGPTGPDYGMFDFQELISRALFNRDFSALTDAEVKSIWDRSEYKISDHMPIWLRVPLPS